MASGDGFVSVISDKVSVKNTWTLLSSFGEFFHVNSPTTHSFYENLGKDDREGI